MHKQSGTVPFVFGVILGVLCMIYLPDMCGPTSPNQ